MASASCSLPAFVLTQMRGITVLEPAALELRLAIGGFSLWKRTIPLATVKDVEQAPFLSFASVLKCRRA